MRWIAAGAFALWGFAVVAEVQAPSSEIRNVITDQIEAFQSGDPSAAFAHASPGIQSMFGTAERFMGMVRNGYPMVWRPSDVRFGALHKEDGNYWQEVLITDAKGKLFAFSYRMVEIDGAWRIAGVEMAPAPGLAV